MRFTIALAGLLLIFLPGLTGSAFASDSSPSFKLPEVTVMGGKTLADPQDIVIRGLDETGEFLVSMLRGNLTARRHCNDLTDDNRASFDRRFGAIEARIYETLRQVARRQFPDRPEAELDRAVDALRSHLPVEADSENWVQVYCIHKLFGSMHNQLEMLEEPRFGAAMEAYARAPLDLDRPRPITLERAGRTLETYTPAKARAAIERFMFRAFSTVGPCEGAHVSDIRVTFEPEQPQPHRFWKWGPQRITERWEARCGDEVSRIRISFVLDNENILTPLRLVRE